MSLPGICDGQGHLHFMRTRRLQAQVADHDRLGCAGLIEDRHEPFPMLVVRATEGCGSTIGDPIARAMETEGEAVPGERSVEAHQGVAVAGLDGPDADRRERGARHDGRSVAAQAATRQG